MSYSQKRYNQLIEDLKTQPKGYRMDTTGKTLYVLTKEADGTPAVAILKSEEKLTFATDEYIAQFIADGLKEG